MVSLQFPDSINHEEPRTIDFTSDGLSKQIQIELEIESSFPIFNKESRILVSKVIKPEPKENNLFYSSEFQPLYPKIYTPDMSIANNQTEIIEKTVRDTERIDTTKLFGTKLNDTIKQKTTIHVDTNEKYTSK